MALAVLAVDQLTKVWAVEVLSDRTIDLVGGLRLYLVRNDGAAFSMGSGYGWAFGLAAIAVAAVLWTRRRSFGPGWAQVAVGMILGGAVGNLLDRLLREDGWLRGRVVDFIDLQWWPVFNVADMGVTVGLVLLLLTTATSRSAPGAG